MCKDILYVLEYHLHDFLAIRHFDDPAKYAPEEDARDSRERQDPHQQQILRAISQEENVCCQVLVQVIYDNWLNQESFNFLPVMQGLC